MGKYIRKAIPACLGASIGATLVECYRYSVLLTSLGGIVKLLFQFALTFVVTLLIVAGLIWLWDRTIGSWFQKGR